MMYDTKKLKDMAIIKTGKLDSNAAVDNGKYPFFTCDPTTLRIDKWAYDTEAVLLAGNNASGNYTAKYYKGRFNAYQRTYIIETVNDEVVLVRFLCYAMNQQLRLLKTMSSGSTTKFLTIKMLHGLDIPCPSIEVQKRIVNILGTIDDLIENNKKQISLLEEAAQRLYKEWFVDFRFPGYEEVAIVDGVPEGWHLGTLEEVLVYHDKLRKPLSSMQRQNFKGQYRYYGAAGVLDNVQNYLFDGTYLLFGEDGSVVNENGNPILQYVTGKFWVNNHAHVFTGKEPYSTEYIYMMFKKMNVSDVVSGVAQPKISKARLNAKKILVPDKNTVMIYNEKVKSIFEQILLLEKVVDLLNKARNSLLPKLMNGEIEV